ncbi:MAG: hypothetical protein IKL03_08545 [Bacteroidaceae bacterium]|nr:hypothetical protein [Bacteroidales bacterium]MBR6629984.1 hypothetical protein [Bacteroidaceae bacterium]
MPTQTPISVKLDQEVYDAIELEMRATGAKRNRIINVAVLEYLNNLDETRRRKSMMVGT